MGVLSYQLSSAGLIPNTTGLGKNISQQLPTITFLETNDTLATVLVTGYLNKSRQDFQIPYNDQQMALVYTTDQGTVWLSIAVSGSNYSLQGTTDVSTIFEASVGTAAAPSYTFVGRTNTGMYSSAANTLDFATDGTRQVSVGGAIVAVNYLLLQGSASTSPVVISALGTATNLGISLVPKGTGAIEGPVGLVGTPGYSFTGDLDTGMWHSAANVLDFSAGGSKILELATTGASVTGLITATTSITATGGALTSGSVAGGSAGSLILFSNTAANGSLRMLAVGNAGNFATTVSDSASVTGQSQVITIPPAGAATANFLLDTGTANIIAMQQFVGISNVLLFATGTWTVTSLAQGNLVSRKTATAETSTISIDITPMIRTTASKGWRLDSFDYIYGITVQAAVAHSIVIDRIAYANNVAVSVTSIAVTGGTLSTATQANPYVTAVTVDTPAFDITADSKYVMTVSAQADTNTVYDFYGVVLKFSQTVA